MSNADSLPSGVQDLLQRMHSTEREVADVRVGVSEAKALAQAAGSAIVDMREDIHDIKTTVTEILVTAQNALREASEAARQGKITNGRVTSIETWKGQHESDVRPVLARAEQGFQDLAALLQRAETEDGVQREKDIRADERKRIGAVVTRGQVAAAVGGIVVVGGIAANARPIIEAVLGFMT